MLLLKSCRLHRFLLQPVERRVKREEEELAVLEKLLEEKRKEIANNRERVDA